MGMLRAERPLHTRALHRGSVSALALVALLWPASSARAQDDAPLPVEALVAIVGGDTPEQGTDLVLLSDVELRARLDLGPNAMAVRPSRPLLAATLDEIVGELLIAREAARLHAADPSPVDVRAQRDRLVAALGGETRLDLLLVTVHGTADEIEAIARRRAFVDAFLRANLEGSTSISDARVEETFESGEHPFASMPLEQAREPLRAWLAVRALSGDVARWVAVLRQRTIVRVLVPLARAASEPEAPIATPDPSATTERPREEPEADVPR